MHNSSNAEYIGKTKQHYRTQALGHIGVFPLTGKCVKKTLKLQLNGMFFCMRVVCPQDFSVLAKSTSNFKLEIQESILINYLSQPYTKLSTRYHNCFDNNNRKKSKNILER